MSNESNPILTWNERGGKLETLHRGRFVVIEEGGRVESYGAVDELTFPRSNWKMLQLLPLFSAPEFQALNLEPKERAILVASHGGDERHVEAVTGVLHKAGLSFDDLGCGIHAPLDRKAADRLVARGEEPSRRHHNCSGKHSGFLLRAKQLGAPLATYLDPDHPVQVEVRQCIADILGRDPNTLEPSIDGCGAPAYRASVAEMAEAFRKLANPSLLPEPFQEGARLIFDVVNREPHYLAGEGFFDTCILSSRPGRFLCKIGADGFFALGVREGDGCPALGLAVKIDDGAKRGFESLVAHYLKKRGLVRGDEPCFVPLLDTDIRNSQGKVVGTRHTVFSDEPLRRTSLTNPD